MMPCQREMARLSRRSSDEERPVYFTREEMDSPSQRRSSTFRSRSWHAADVRVDVRVDVPLDVRVDVRGLQGPMPSHVAFGRPLRRSAFFAPETRRVRSTPPAIVLETLAVSNAAAFASNENVASSLPAPESAPEPVQGTELEWMRMLQ